MIPDILSNEKRSASIDAREYEEPSVMVPFVLLEPLVHQHFVFVPCSFGTCMCFCSSPAKSMVMC